MALFTLRATHAPPPLLPHQYGMEQKTGESESERIEEGKKDYEKKYEQRKRISGKHKETMQAGEHNERSAERKKIKKYIHREREKDCMSRERAKKYHCILSVEERQKSVVFFSAFFGLLWSRA